MIGVFDSGFGGLTVFQGLVERLPQYDYLYLADRARGPYGALSEEVINAYTRQAVEYLFDQGCPLVILACNTASARALRNLQQRMLPQHFPSHRILGVVRPSVEALAGIPVGAVDQASPTTARGNVAVLATRATIESNSYGLELAKLAPQIRLIQQACPLWVPMIEEGELSGPGIDYYLHKYLDPLLDGTLERPARVLLGCTHYPILMPGIRAILPPDIEVLAQAHIVAERLADWLQRHPEMEARLTRTGSERFTVTADRALFEAQTAQLLGRSVRAHHVHLGVRG
jgi:glutamate racemase